MEKSKKRICFITRSDVMDRHRLSGTSYYLFSALKKEFEVVESIHCLAPGKVNVEWLLKNIFTKKAWIFGYEKFKGVICKKIFKKNYQWERTIPVSKYYAKEIEKQLKEKDYNFIFGDKASIEIALLSTNIPIVHTSDATFAAMVDFYSGFSNLTKNQIKVGNFLEKKVLEKSKFVILTSNWAKQSAIVDYGVNEMKINILPRPVLTEDYLENLIHEKSFGKCNLLFSGVDWGRKGGDIAIETLNELRKLDINAYLYVMGYPVPEKDKNNQYIEELGFLKKDNSEDIKTKEDAFLNAHFFILPTRAECQANVLSEACAYGLPILVTNVGGTSECINDNGFLMNMEDRGIEYAKKIKHVFKNNEVYSELSMKSRELYDKKLNINFWARKVREIIES